MALSLSNTTRNSMVDALTGDIDAGGAGELVIYGDPRPANADAVVGAAPVLATVTLSATSFNPAANGVATLVDPPEITASADGEATWFRISSGGGAAVFDGSVSNSAGTGDLKLATTALTDGLTVDITTGQISMPAA